MVSGEREAVIFGLNLKRERELRGWTQMELATHLGCGVSTVIRWEKGGSLPHASMQQKIYQLFEKTQDLIMLAEGKRRQHISNVPFYYNPYFIGRQDVLKKLHRLLISQDRKICALSGLGGIGKTQTAAIYARLHANDYQAILWVRADTTETLRTDFLALADLLNIPGRLGLPEERVLEKIKEAISKKTPWLLILDNVNNVREIYPLLPSGRGSILLTTRLQSQPTGKHVKRIPLEKLNRKESFRFLLDRTNLNTPLEEKEQQAVEKLVDVLDGLPLALEQTAAYIEETGCAFSTYVELYEQNPEPLWEWTSSLASGDYPHTLATTWMLSFQQVEQECPAATDLLRICSLLHPDAIPKEIITLGAAFLGSQIQALAGQETAVENLFDVLKRYSLIKEIPATESVMIHRLVQEILRKEMSKNNATLSTLPLWVQRVVQALNAAFPDGAFHTWDQCERLLLHVQTCAHLVEQYQIVFPEAIALFQRTADYLHERSRYAEAERFLSRALSMSKDQHIDTLLSAAIAGSYGALRLTQVRCAEARTFLLQALSLLEGRETESLVTTLRALRDLAETYHIEKQYSEAEVLYKRGLALCQQNDGLPARKQTARFLGILGELYHDQHDFCKAEMHVKQALAIYEQHFSTDYMGLAELLNNLALIYSSQERYNDAEPLYVRCLKLFENALVDEEHRFFATSYLNLGYVYKKQGKYKQAEMYLNRAWGMRERVLGAWHPDMVNLCNHLADVLEALGRIDEALRLLQRALAINERHYGKEYPVTLTSSQRLDQFCKRHHREIPSRH